MALSLRARNWVFTVNFNYETGCPPYELFPDVWEASGTDIVSYCCWQMEIGADTGREHLQGYLETKGKQSRQKLLTLDGFDTQLSGYSIFLDPRRGTQAQAIDYCRKVDGTEVPGTFVEWGTRKRQGSRQDLDDVKDLIDAGASMKRVADEAWGSFIRYHRSFKEYKRISSRVRTARTMVLILVGKSGCGKTRLARDMFPDAYWKTNDKWWCDYENEPAVVWDEFKGQYPYRDLLRILDSSPLRCESKGSSICFNSEIVIFTTNHHPSTWYSPEVMPDWESSPLKRRINEYGQIMMMGSQAPPPIMGLMPIAFGERAGQQPLQHVLGNARSYVP